MTKAYFYSQKIPQMPGNFTVVRKYWMKWVKSAEEDCVNILEKKVLSDLYTCPILCGCCWAPICQISTERTKTSDASNSRNIILLTGKRNKIRRGHFLPVKCYWYMFYLAILHFKQNAFNHFTVIFLNYLISLNLFVTTNVYFKYILWSVIIW